MAVSFYDPSIAWVPGGTPGAVWRTVRNYASIGVSTFVIRGQRNISPVPAEFMGNGLDGYVGSLGVNSSFGAVAFYLKESNEDGTGFSSGPSLSDDGKNKLGIVIRTAAGTVLKWRIADIIAFDSDSADPYQFIDASLGITSIFENELKIAGAQGYLVDASSPNVDWDNEQFVSPDTIKILNETGEWRVRIAGRDVSEWVQKDSVRIELRFNQRAQASFRMELDILDAPPLMEWPRRKPVPRSSVDIWWVGYTGEQTHRFAGVLFTSPVTIEPGARWMVIECNAPSLAARLDEVFIEGYERTIDGETVAQCIKRLFLKYGGPTGIDTSGVVGSDVVDPDVFDYISLRNFLGRMEEQSNSAWKVTPGGVLDFRPSGSFPINPLVLTLSDVELMTVDDDLQRQRTRQIIVGGNLPSGQQRDEFTADGNTREFQLSRRLDQLIEFSVGGVSQNYGTDEDGHEWIIDKSRSTVTRRSSFPNLLMDTRVVAHYDYEGTVLLAAQDQTAVETYGVVTNIHQDGAIANNEQGETALLRELNRHNGPVVNISTRTNFREVPDIIDGELLGINIPEIGVVDERWLVDLVANTSDGDTLIHDLHLLAGDYEELGEDHWRRLQRLTGSTESFRTLTLPDGRMIDPNVLLHEGLNLPAQFGGSEQILRRDNQWSRVPNSAIVPVDGLRLPVGTVQVSFTARLSRDAEDTWTGEVRLYNSTDSTAVGDPVTVTSSAAAPYFIRGLTLAGKLANHELQSRCSADAGRRQGIRVWGGELDVHQ